LHVVTNYMGKALTFNVTVLLSLQKRIAFK